METLAFVIFFTALMIVLFILERRDANKNVRERREQQANAHRATNDTSNE